jgi:DNA ligase-1
MEWRIYVAGSTIVTKYGQVGGKIQSTKDLISEGKNLGQKDETTPRKQARLEAKSKWEHQIKSGYTADEQKARRGSDDIGGLKPCLAAKFEDHKNKVVFPAFISRKLNGMRCMAEITNGQVRLLSRTRKLITSVPLIESVLTSLFKGMNVVLDGELYTDKLKFEDLMSICRKTTSVDQRAQLVQFHIFDAIIDGQLTQPFYARRNWLESQFRRLKKSHSLRKVLQVRVESMEDINSCYSQYLEEGNEGAIVRSYDAPYEQKRTSKLLKLKSMQDAEFEILDLREGRGRMKGKAIFICQGEGGIFKVKMEGALDKLRSIWQRKEDYIGRLLKVRFFELSKKQIPIHPVAVEVRDPE